MSEMRRRELLELLALAPLAGAFRWTPLETDRAARRAQAVRGAHAPQFFTAHEWATVRVLVDLILPADERSGSATQAGVPEFMDFIMLDQPGRQTAMRGGLAWIDVQCRQRFGQPLTGCTEPQRRALLDEIAWPRKAPPALAHGVAFFNSFRDLTASGFYSSAMGIADVQYLGNTVVPEWTGCPDAQLKKLGVRYAD